MQEKRLVLHILGFSIGSHRQRSEESKSRERTSCECSLVFEQDVSDMQRKDKFRVQYLRKLTEEKVQRKFIWGWLRGPVGTSQYFQSFSFAICLFSKIIFCHCGFLYTLE